jgi:hypothetical protein
MLDGNPIKPNPGQMRELDEDEDSLEEELDEIDLEKISGLSLIEPSAGNGRNVWGNKQSKKRDRKVRNGPATHQMPDFNKMVMTGKRGRKQDTLLKPFDEDFLSNPFGNKFLESNKNSLADYILGLEEEQDKEYLGYRPSMSSEMKSMLEKMSGKLGIKKIITENYDLDEEFDLDLEEDDEV